MAKMIQRDFDSVYCYPNSNVLINKLGITDLDKLQRAERDITSLVHSSLIENPISGNLDYAHLKKIHKYLFQDIYDWAGKERNVNIAKNELFCTAPCIKGMSEDIFNKLGKDNYLIGLPEDKFTEKLAYYFGEINALHPFREGNGRTQREFLRILALTAGYELVFTKMSSEEMLQASIDTFNCKYEKMEKLIRQSLEKLSYEQQRVESKKVLLFSGEPARALKKYNKYIEEIANDISRSGFKPIEKIIRKIERLHRQSGRRLSIKDIKDLYVSKDFPNKEMEETVKEIAKEFIMQEKAINLSIEREL